MYKHPISILSLFAERVVVVRYLERVYADSRKSWNGVAVDRYIDKEEEEGREEASPSLTVSEEGTEAVKELIMRRKLHSAPNVPRRRFS